MLLATEKPLLTSRDTKNKSLLKVVDQNNAAAYFSEAFAEKLLKHFNTTQSKNEPVILKIGEFSLTISKEFIKNLVTDLEKFLEKTDVS